MDARRERGAGTTWSLTASNLSQGTCRFVPHQDGFSLLIQSLPGWLLALIVPPEWRGLSGNCYSTARGHAGGRGRPDRD
jgi:hypothetical protein